MSAPAPRRPKPVADTGPDSELRSRVRIDRVAVRLFARYGYDGVSLQRIADEVGLHKSTLFHHYASKLELLDSVLDAVLERVLTCMAPLGDSEPPDLEVLLDVLDRLVDHFSDEPDAARLLVSLMTSVRVNPPNHVLCQTTSVCSGSTTRKNWRR